MNKLVSVIIPCFNEERTIASVITKVIASETPGYELEIILVNDGSTDGTLASVLPFSGRIKQITLEKNQGKGSAVKEGLKLAAGSIYLIQDADLEYDPADYSLLLTPFNDPEIQVVYGIRDRKNLPLKVYLDPFYWGGKGINFLLNFVAGSTLLDVHTGYKVFRDGIIRIEELRSQRFSFCHELTLLFLAKGIAITQVPISYHPRTIAEGKKIRPRDGLEAAALILATAARNKLLRSSGVGKKYCKEESPGK